MALAVLLALVRVPSFISVHASHAQMYAALETDTDVVQLEEPCDKIRRSYLLCHPLSADPSFVDNRSLAAVYDKTSVARRQTDLASLDITAYEPTGHDQILWHRRGHQLDLLIKADADQRYIVRGARRGLNFHRVHAWLPEHLQLMLLDILEDITTDKQPILEREGQRWIHLDLRHMTAYDYLLVSAYDMERHSSVGKIMRLELSE